METNEKRYCVTCLRQLAVRKFNQKTKMVLFTCSLSCEKERQSTLKPTEDPVELKIRETIIRHHEYWESKANAPIPNQTRLEDRPNFSEEGFAWDECNVLI